MKRFGYIVVLAALVAWGVVAAVLSGRGSAHVALPPSGPSPACLPGQVERSSTIAGTPLHVSPVPESAAADPNVQISFLGLPVSDITNVDVEGSQSGYHHGHLSGYWQGDGGSFVPYQPFAEGEHVRVRADVRLPGGTTRRLDYGFNIDTPYPTSHIPGFPNPAASPAAVQSFASAPELQPPLLTVTHADQSPASGDVLMSVGPGPGQAGALIYTPQGRLVWFHRAPSGENILGLSRQTYEGRPVLTWWQGQVRELGFGQGEDVVVNSNYQKLLTVHASNGLQADLHDFQIEPRDVAYITAYNVIRCDLSSHGGTRNGSIIVPAIQEIDMKTGLVRWEWSSLDHVPVSLSHTPAPTVAEPWDYFHLNSIDVLPDGGLLISARATWAAYKLAPGSGKIEWSLGGDHPTIQPGAGTGTAWQHDARMLPNGEITMFDDGSNPRVHYQSRGVRLRISGGKATLTRQYFHPNGPFVADSQGNVQTVPGGGVVVGWGAIPSITEFSQSGGLLFDAHLPPGDSSYRAFRFPWAGRPLAPPAVAARVLVNGDATALAVSWNGATGVARWRILAGNSSAALTPQVTVPDSGFETTTQFPEAFKYAAVEALDSAGNVIGVSPPVSVKPAAPVESASK